MFIVLSPNSGVPVYRQLIEQIRLQATGGRLAPGDEMPSTRILSAQLGVNPMTVSKAYASLEQEGVLERRPGRPLVVKTLAPEQARRKKLEQIRESLSPAAITIRQLGVTPDEAVDILREMLDKANDPEEKR
ncbi:GntR family transcriptional regulator [bacterium]|nr:GntR family transcriptional regulator [bacterium]MBU1073013.1 GntR family transcriptional regulator [bacterium]MBU1675258.1 GntR family transcriptional regulator [bacterium]